MLYMSYAKRFWTEFKKIIANEIAQNANFMDIYKSNRYTHIMNDADGVIYNTIKAIDSSMNFQKEYLRVDVTAWKSVFDGKHDWHDAENWKEKFRERHLKPHLWNLYFAVEHENKHEDWLDEVLKLAHLRCPLKVVIGYVPAGKRNNDYSGDKERLELAVECLKWTKAYERQPDTYVNNGGGYEEFLVILGNCSGKYDEPNYKGYLFNGIDRFEEIG